MASVIAVVGLAALVACVAARRLGDFDLPMHLALGQRVWETHSVPRVDDFSYLHGHVRYVELLSVTLFHLAMRAGGAAGLQLVGGVSAGVLAVASWLHTRRAGPAALTVVALSVGAAGSFLVVRSSALSFPLLALTLLALDAHRAAGPSRAGRRALAAYVLLMLTWANTHGSVTLGLVVGATYAAHCAACRLARGRAAPWLRAWLPEREGADAVAVGVAWAASLAAASLNSAGPALLPGPLRFGGRVDTLAAFSEWARPTWGFFRDHEPWFLVVLALAVVAAAIGREPATRSRVPPAYDAALFALALACAATAVRLLPFAAILSAPWTARRLARALPPSRVAWLACSGSTLFAAWRALAAPLPLGVGFDTTHLPEGAVRWIDAHAPAGPMWNTPPFGGYLAYRLYPRARVLMDGRHGLAYDLADVEAVAASDEDAAAFDALARDHGIEWGVTRAFEGVAAGVPLAAESHDWAMVYLDDVAAVYVRRAGPNAALAAGGYRVLRHLTAPAQALRLAARGGPRAIDLAHDGALAVEQAPGSARAAFFGACGALAVRDADGYRRARAHLAALAPASPALAVLDGAWAAAAGDRE